MILPTTEKELDEWKREVAIKHVKRLSGQIGLRHQVPKVIFDLAELDETMKELINKHEVPDWHQNCYGAYFPHIHAVYLNVSSFGKRPSSADRGYIGDLIETIAHELAHARFRGLPHGDEFNKRVRQILNGKQFTWVIFVLPKNGKSQATGEQEEPSPRSFERNFSENISTTLRLIILAVYIARDQLWDASIKSSSNRLSPLLASDNLVYTTYHRLIVWYVYNPD